MLATTTEMTASELTAYIGRKITDLPAGTITPEAWAVVDENDLTITSVIHGYDDLSEYETAELIDGEVVRGEQYCQFVVRNDF